MQMCTLLEPNMQPDCQGNIEQISTSSRPPSIEQQSLPLIFGKQLLPLNNTPCSLRSEEGVHHSRRCERRQGLREDEGVRPDATPAPGWTPREVADGC
jgi:hypothetical protein